MKEGDNNKCSFRNMQYFLRGNSAILYMMNNVFYWKMASDKATDIRHPQRAFSSIFQKPYVFKKHGWI